MRARSDDVSFIETRDLSEGMVEAELPAAYQGKTAAQSNGLKPWDLSGQLNFGVV
jgi:hypothetical protein